MIPYIDITPIFLDIRGLPLGVSAFSATIFMGVVCAVLRSRARFVAIGEPSWRTYELFCWIVIPAFIGTEVLGKLMYEPLAFVHAVLNLNVAELRTTPSSMCGMLTGALAFWLYSRRARLQGERWFAFVDILSYAALIGYTFGRLGCSIMHDHPGVLSSSLMAVRFPEGARLDMGLLEFLYLLLIVNPLALMLSIRKARPGAQFSAIVLSYSLGRFALDFMRYEEETRYLGFTPAQFCCVGFLLALVSMLFRASLRARRGRKIEHHTAAVNAAI